MLLLGVALGTALALGGLKIGPIEISGDSLLIPLLIIGGRLRAVHGADRCAGRCSRCARRSSSRPRARRASGPIRIMFSEILPNLSSTIIVFFPLMVANAILLEAALSFLGAGVRPPTPSWGTMIGAGRREDRHRRRTRRSCRASMLVLTVLALNVFGDGVRDAFDPRAKVRVEH